MPYRFKKHYTLAEARAMLPKVSEWLDSKIDDEWRKQFMPLVEDAEDPEYPEGNEGQ